MPATGAAMTDVFEKTKHRRGTLSGVVSVKPAQAGFDIWYGVVVVGLLNSECPQQNRADESEHGAHGEHIQSQGKVHGSCLPC
jgi:hypothetical protein